MASEHYPIQKNRDLLCRALNNEIGYLKIKEAVGLSQLKLVARSIHGLVSIVSLRTSLGGFLESDFEDREIPHLLTWKGTTVPKDSSAETTVSWYWPLEVDDLYKDTSLEEPNVNLERSFKLKSSEDGQFYDEHYALPQNLAESTSIRLMPGFKHSQQFYPSENAHFFYGDSASENLLHSSFKPVPVSRINENLHHIVNYPTSAVNLSRATGKNPFFESSHLAEESLAKQKIGKTNLSGLKFKKRGRINKPKVTRGKQSNDVIVNIGIHPGVQHIDNSEPLPFYNESLFAASRKYNSTKSNNDNVIIARDDGIKKIPQSLLNPKDNVVIYVVNFNSQTEATREQPIFLDNINKLFQNKVNDSPLKYLPFPNDISHIYTGDSNYINASKINIPREELVLENSHSSTPADDDATLPESEIDNNLDILQEEYALPKNYQAAKFTKLKNLNDSMAKLRSPYKQLLNLPLNQFSNIDYDYDMYVPLNKQKPAGPKQASTMYNGRVVDETSSERKRMPSIQDVYNTDDRLNSDELSNVFSSSLDKPITSVRSGKPADPPDVIIDTKPVSPDYSQNNSTDNSEASNTKPVKTLQTTEKLESNSVTTAKISSSTTSRRKSPKDLWSKLSGGAKRKFANIKRKWLNRKHYRTKPGPGTKSLPKVSRLHYQNNYDLAPDLYFTGYEGESNNGGNERGFSKKFKTSVSDKQILNENTATVGLKEFGLNEEFNSENILKPNHNNSIILNKMEYHNPDIFQKWYTTEIYAFSKNSNNCFNNSIEKFDAPQMKTSFGATQYILRKQIGASDIKNESGQSSLTQFNGNISGSKQKTLSNIAYQTAETDRLRRTTSYHGRPARPPHLLKKFSSENSTAISYNGSYIEEVGNNDAPVDLHFSDGLETDSSWTLEQEEEENRRTKKVITNFAGNSNVMPADGSRIFLKTTSNTDIWKSLDEELKIENDGQNGDPFEPEQNIAHHIVNRFPNNTLLFATQ